jgi:glyoxylase-like metal-dependent hydrolase (beta-lactamase superfamily II)
MPPATSDAERLRAVGVLRLRAPNPGPLTLSGTNTWVFGRDPAWVVDPGPALAQHLDNLFAALAERGGLGGIVLTHDHVDHSDGLAALRERFPAPLAAGRTPAASELADGVRFGASQGELELGEGARLGAVGGDVELTGGAQFGPFEAIATPGHTPDHFSFIAGGVCFTGDAVLGEGSVFIAPHPGALAGYLDALARLRLRELEVLCPGHGPPIWTPERRLSEYIEHRLDRERRLLAALAEGRRATAELLDAAWSDVPAALRPVAAITLTAHLDKLADEGRLPDGVHRTES